MRKPHSWVAPMAVIAPIFASTAVNAQSDPRACVPECRIGFTCVDGACVSQCNPPCLSGEVCTEKRECMLRSELPDLGSVRHHGGFYLRFGLGVGLLRGDVTQYRSEGMLAAGRKQRATEGSITGVAQLGEIMMGGTVADGLVFGGGAWGVNAFSAEYEGTLGMTFTDEVEEGSSELELTSLSQVGPFLLYYPDASSGLHGLLAPTFVVAVLGNKKDLAIRYDDRGADGVGWGLIVGVGYDFWIGEQWSLGVAARFQYVSAVIESTDPQSTFSAFVPGVLGTVTYH